MDTPDASIEAIYHPALTENGITTAYNETESVRNRVAELRDTIDQVILEKRTELGTAHIRPLNLSADQAASLRTAIKADRRWQKSTQNLVEAIEPQLAQTPLQAQLDAISLPWWNAAVLSSTSDAYDPASDGLHLDTTMTHSYISQMLRSLKIKRPANVNAISVSNVLLTADGLIALGLRAGHSYANTIMAVPAGSVEYHTGRNPLFETLYAEHDEEDGLQRDDCVRTELLGKIHDNALGQISLYVFRTLTSLTFAELLDVWDSAIDNREHKFLIPIQDDPSRTLEFLLAHRYDRSKADPDTLSKTTLANVNTVLPPCAASLLLHHTHDKGDRLDDESDRWVRHAQAALGGQYTFNCGG